MQNDFLIIADASCLIALYNISELDLLQTLFQEIYITPEIAAEVKAEKPNWIKIKSVKDEEKISELHEVLDLGEASAIALALESKDALLIIDERKGRSIAKSLKIPIIGTLGILIEAKRAGIAKDYIAIIEKLRADDFRMSDKLLIKVLDILQA
ncbi:MAG: DUF3368 domain-containing protein [Bacteroidota bacterium]